MEFMDNFKRFKVSSLAHVINEDVRNREFRYAHETIDKSIEHWKDEVNYELLCNEAQIMTELMTSDEVFDS